MQKLYVFASPFGIGGVDRQRRISDCSVIRFVKRFERDVSRCVYENPDVGLRWERRQERNAGRVWPQKTPRREIGKAFVKEVYVTFYRATNNPLSILAKREWAPFAAISLCIAA